METRQTFRNSLYVGCQNFGSQVLTLKWKMYNLKFQCTERINFAVVKCDINLLLLQYSLILYFFLNDFLYLEQIKMRTC
jgi:hypothetical protein